MNAPRPRARAPRALGGQRSGAWVGTAVAVALIAVGITVNLASHGRGHDPARNVTGLAIATASSYCTSGDNAPYQPGNVLDGKTYTCWTEADGQPRIGQYVKLSLRRVAEIDCVGVYPGYDKISRRYGDLFGLNDRLKSADVQFSDGTTKHVFFVDRRGMQYFSIKPSVRAEWMKLAVTGYYPGSRWDDLCIAEIQLWGHE